MAVPLAPLSLVLVEPPQPVSRRMPRAPRAIRLLAGRIRRADVGWGDVLAMTDLRDEQ